MPTRTEARTIADPTIEDASLDARAEGLAARCRAGDDGVFEELVSLTEPKVRRLLGRLAGRGADLDDLVQEVYLRAWRSLPGFRGESRFTTWLYRIAANAACTWRRRRVDVHLGEEAARSIRSRTTLGEVPLMNAYGHALANLPPEMRAAFVLHEAEGLSYREVAEVLGCPIGTVMSRLHRARTRILDELRERLEELAP